jgi:hypothetical protein
MILETLYKIAFPTMAYIEDNPNKVVRKLGEVGVIFPMLPWTLLWVAVIFVGVGVFLTSEEILKWWRK